MAHAPEGSQFFRFNIQILQNIYAFMSGVGTTRYEAGPLGDILDPPPVYYNTFLEIYVLEFRLLSHIFYTTYLKIIITKIREQHLLLVMWFQRSQRSLVALILCDLKYTRTA